MLAVFGLGELLWSMLVFFFWFMAIWIFISLFGDILRRRDLFGGAKAGWLLLLFVLPFIGSLVYMVSRPAMTEQDKEEVERAVEAHRRLEGYSAADEIEKVARLRDDGKISTEEYEELKRKAMIQF